MITIKEWMELVGFRITEGTEFGWQCFGSYAYALDSWNGDNQKGYSLTMVFDTRTQVVYQVEVHDYKRERAYSFTNPDFIEAYNDEEQARGAIDYDYKMIELEVLEDWVEKATAIVAGKKYDKRVQIPLNLPNDVMIELMTLAHAEDITLNKMVEKVLKVAIERAENDCS
jgi:hypothetical protein